MLEKEKEEEETRFQIFDHWIFALWEALWSCNCALKWRRPAGEALSVNSILDSSADRQMEPARQWRQYGGFGLQRGEREKLQRSDNVIPAWLNDVSWNASEGLTWLGSVYLLEPLI